MAELKAQGKLPEALHGAASLAQDQIEHLMKKGYQEHEAREVVLAQFILLPLEGDGLEDWEREELDEMEAEYQKHPQLETLTAPTKSAPNSGIDPEILALGAELAASILSAPARHTAIGI